jgi:predicted transcriptional regulator
LPPTTSVRVYPETRERLQRLGAERRQTTADLIADLVAAAEERAMIAQFNAHFDDAQRAAAFHAEETAPLDGTLTDGLRDLG